MPDRLEEIKEAWYDVSCDHQLELAPKAINWLISEVERLRGENERLHRFVDEVDKLFENVKRERVGK